MTQESTELAEILALYTGVEALVKQTGSWSIQVPPEQRYYHPEGKHSGPRGGKFSVIGTEVDRHGDAVEQPAQSQPSVSGSPGPHDIGELPSLPQPQQAEIDFEETLELPEITEDLKDNSPLKFYLETVAGMVEYGEQFPRYWSHRPPSHRTKGTLGPSKKGGIQAYKISGGGGEAEGISEKFIEGSSQKIVWLQSPADPNDPYIVDASKLNLHNVGAEASGFQHAGDIPPEAIVKGSDTQPQQAEEKEVGIQGKEPWEMTQEEFASPAPLPQAKPGNIILYHVTDEKNLSSILQEGLDPNKNWGGEGPRGVVWGVTSPEGYSGQGVVVGVEIPESRLGSSKDAEWKMASGRISPDAIVYVDKPSELTGNRMRVERADEYAKKYHEWHVEEALKEGKSVPEDVLRDYPDLSKEQPQQAEEKVLPPEIQRFLDSNSFDLDDNPEITQAVIDSVDASRVKELGEKYRTEHNYVFAQWVAGKYEYITGVRAVLAEMRGEELDRDRITAVFRELNSHKDDPLPESDIPGYVDWAIKSGRAMAGGDDAVDIFKMEQSFAEKRTKELFGDSMTVYRAVYGKQADQIREVLDADGEIEIDNLVGASFSTSRSSSYIFAKSQAGGRGDNIMIMKHELKADEVLSAWYSHNGFNFDKWGASGQPYQQEVVANPKNSSVRMTKDDFVPSKVLEQEFMDYAVENIRRGNVEEDGEDENL